MRRVIRHPSGYRASCRRPCAERRLAQWRRGQGTWRGGKPGTWRGEATGESSSGSGPHFGGRGVSVYYPPYYAYAPYAYAPYAYAPPPVIVQEPPVYPEAAPAPDSPPQAYCTTVPALGPTIRPLRPARSMGEWSRRGPSSPARFRSRPRLTRSSTARPAEDGGIEPPRRDRHGSRDRDLPHGRFRAPCGRLRAAETPGGPVIAVLLPTSSSV